MQAVADQVHIICYQLDEENQAISKKGFYKPPHSKFFIQPLLSSSWIDIMYKSVCLRTDADWILNISFSQITLLSHLCVLLNMGFDIWGYYNHKRKHQLYLSSLWIHQDTLIAVSLVVLTHYLPSLPHNPAQIAWTTPAHPFWWFSHQANIPP